MTKRKPILLMVEESLYIIRYRGKRTKRDSITYTYDIQLLGDYVITRKAVPVLLSTVRNMPEIPWSGKRYRHENVSNPCEKSRIHSWYEVSYVTEDQCFRAVFNQPRI